VSGGPEEGAIRFQTLLLPVDFSKLSEAAACYARTVSQRFGSRVHAVHVIPLESLVALHPQQGTAVAAAPQPQIEEARAALAFFVATHLSGLDVVQRVLCGGPAVELARYAEDAGCDLVVMGTHADGVLKRLVFGSVSKSVLESAPCAVLLVPLAAVVSEG
jgi:nucleotide-binding universal stress UspA family protein